MLATTNIKIVCPNQYPCNHIGCPFFHPNRNDVFEYNNNYYLNTDTYSLPNYIFVQNNCNTSLKLTSCICSSNRLLNDSCPFHWRKKQELLDNIIYINPRNLIDDFMEVDNSDDNESINSINTQNTINSTYTYNNIPLCKPIKKGLSRNMCKLCCLGLKCTKTSYNYIHLDEPYFTQEKRKEFIQVLAQKAICRGGFFMINKCQYGNNCKNIHYGSQLLTNELIDEFRKYHIEKTYILTKKPISKCFNTDANHDPRFCYFIHLTDIKYMSDELRNIYFQKKF